jgi:hypothetical protein
MEWFYAKNNEKRGPVSGSQLKSMVVSGEVAGADLVWCEGMADWIPANEVQNFDDPNLGSSDSAGLPSQLPNDPVSTTPAMTQPSFSSAVPVPIKRPANSKAIVSLVCGCGGLVTCCSFGVLSLVAVIFGHLAKSEIKNSSGQQGGEGMAVAGLVTGYIGLALGFVGIISALADM